jgi:DedD protein
MNDLLKRRLVGAGVLAAGLLLFAVLFFRTEPEPLLSEQQASDLADVRTYEIEVPAVPEREPAQILEDGPPIGTLLPGPAKQEDGKKGDTKVAKSSTTTAQAKPKPVADTPQLSPIPDVGWSVQVGSFASRDNANGLQKKLKDKGYPAFVYRNVAENPPLHRVRVGPYTQRAEAETASQRLREELKLDVTIVSNG